MENIIELSLWLKFIADIISYISWPITVGLVVFFIREPLIAILSKLTNLNKLKAKGVELEFETEIKEVTTSLDINTPNLNKDPRTKSKIKDPYVKSIEDIVNIHPSAAILEAWKTLEFELRMLSNHLGIHKDEVQTTGQNLSIRALLDHYKMAEALTVQTSNTIIKLLDLSNVATHDKDLNVTSKMALEYLYAVDKILSYIEEFYKEDETL